MAHPSYPNSDADSVSDTSEGPNRRPSARTPRWLRVAGIVVATALVLLFVVLHVTGVLGPGIQ